MTAPQQKPRQREENRYGQVEAAEQPPGDPVGVPGLKCDMGDHHTDRRAGTHPLDGGQEAARPAHLLGVSHATSLPVVPWPLHCDLQFCC
jgi:hypothetical protein